MRGGVPFLASILGLWGKKKGTQYRVPINLFLPVGLADLYVEQVRIILYLRQQRAGKGTQKRPRIARGQSDREEGAKTTAKWR